ncbi:MAG: metallophosphoesterase family protein [Cyclobacteriaceae bacterium]
MKIILLSDTHTYWDEKLSKICSESDEIWHAGDIGSGEIADQIAAIKPLQAVYGNIDGHEIRAQYPEDLWFEREGLSVWMTHIGGYPPRYNPRVRQQLTERQPGIFVCGHSHILKVIRDEERGGILCLNPGAAGRQGFHKMRTLLRFELAAGKVKNMEAVELGK